jgi:hypothetical protein
MAQDTKDQFPVLLERRLKMQRSPNGSLTDVVVEIGHPYWTELNRQAACPVAIRGCIERVNDIHSIDPISAMKEAIKFVETFLDQPSDGKKFFWPDGDEY